uniref:Uncharacterized protein n=1 Tax=Glossina austeni TaxID=7395 RepID=A0A1A9UXG3_GLOAU
MKSRQAPAPAAPAPAAAAAARLTKMAGKCLNISGNQRKDKSYTLAPHLKAWPCNFMFNLNQFSINSLQTEREELKPIIALHRVSWMQVKRKITDHMKIMEGGLAWLGSGACIRMCTYLFKNNKICK